MRTDYIYAFSPATAIQDGIIYDFFFFSSLSQADVTIIYEFISDTTLPQCACYHAPYNWE